MSLDLINTKLVAIETNKASKLKIDALNTKLTNLKTTQEQHINANSKLNISIATKQSQIQQLESIIQEIKDYEYANTKYKVFQHVISNRGLNKYVFDTVALQINAELNALLEDLNFRIFFDLDDNYTLKMVDLLGTASIRNLYTIGGMEGTLGALSLLAIIKSKTIKNNGDFIFVDEITGKLNDSKNTKGSEVTNKDYHYEFFNILKKLSKHTNIAIIDHVLPIEWFKSVINIVKQDNGTSRLV
jgi:DNA repair exonuclease SbcCD ATPase subunit